MPEANDENLIIFWKMKWKVDINKSNITSAYSVDQQTQTKPKYVVIVFKNSSVKMTVYNKKNILKGTKILIKGDLIDSPEKHGLKNVLTLNEHIFARIDPEGEKINLFYCVNSWIDKIA